MICCVRASVCACWNSCSLSYSLANMYTSYMAGCFRKTENINRHTHTQPHTVTLIHIHKYPNWDSMRSANSNSMPTIIIKIGTEWQPTNISSQKNFSNPFIPFKRNKMKTLHIAWHGIAEHSDWTTHLHGIGISVEMTCTIINSIIKNTTKTFPLTTNSAIFVMNFIDIVLCMHTYKCMNKIYVCLRIMLKALVNCIVYISICILLLCARAMFLQPYDSCMDRRHIGM